jgi:hypothetical protein
MKLWAGWVYVMENYAVCWAALFAGQSVLNEQLVAVSKIDCLNPSFTRL